MATYRSIVGHKINKVSSDPAEPLTGQMWYNSTTGTLRALGVSQAWSSAAPLSTARYGSVAAGNTQNAALVAAGTQAPSYTGYNTTEEYNGSGWTAGGNFPASGGGGRGCGTLTAALGLTTSVTNYYNGTAWTAQPSPAHNLPTTKSGIGLCGTQTAAVAFGGYVPGPNTRTNATEEYDGEGWTATNTMPTSVSSPQGFGIQTAAVSAGGDLGPANTTANAEYNGTSWTAATAVPVAIKDGFACGTQTAGMLASGAGPSPADVVSTNFLSYDGTSWTTIPSMATSRRDNLGGSNGAPNTSTVQGGGNNPPTASIGNTEEYNVSTNVITAAAWASGGSLSTARRGLASGKNSQTLTSGLVFGGGGSPYGPVGVATEEYNGSSWTGGGNMNSPRYLLGGAGTQTAGLGFGGYVYPPPVSSSATEEYNGSSWTSVNSLPEIRQDLSSFGTQTAAIGTAGWNRPGTVNYSTTISYDGTNWTTLSSPANVNTQRLALSGSGTQTAGLATGGNTSPYKQTEEWNGSSWTSQNSSINEHKNVNNSQLGIQTNALICGGGPPPSTATEGYDGTSWSTRPSMATGRYGSAGGGSATSGFIAGGFDTANNTAVTEEFTGETTASNIATFSTS